jgi:hypothetical protein
VLFLNATHLPIFATGQRDGIVVDVGFGETRILPVRARCVAASLPLFSLLTHTSSTQVLQTYAETKARVSVPLGARATCLATRGGSVRRAVQACGTSSNTCRSC